MGKKGNKSALIGKKKKPNPSLYWWKSNDGVWTFRNDNHEFKSPCFTKGRGVTLERAKAIKQRRVNTDNWELVKVFEGEE